MPDNHSMTIISFQLIWRLFIYEMCRILFWVFISVYFSFTFCQHYDREQADLSNDYETVKKTYNGEFDCTSEYF